ncbi:hypothetical protein FOA52_000118 [Chlamydomonas sp. UWO 241]|nr:hypothetical protein FOA52_000118 [Chlamydomonas sp. UWO 241]
MACLRRMLLVTPPQGGAVFPRLQSLRLDLGAAAIASHADYEAITGASPWLTHLSLELPASDTDLPQQMAVVLSACSKLEGLAIRDYDDSMPAAVPRYSSIVDIGALAAGTQLLSVKLPWCRALRNLQSLAAMANLQSLDYATVALCLI